MFQVFSAMPNVKTSAKPSSPSKQYFIPNNDVDFLLQMCDAYKFKGVICLGINERPNEQTKITDKLPKINVILFDIDVRKHKKKNGISPLKLKKEAKEVMERCKTKLKEFGFVVDLMVDSGNGYHIYIKIDLDIPKYDSKEEFEELPIYKRLVYLETQLREVDTKNVEIDFLSKDIIRRVKIPGTYNVKRYKDIDGKFKLIPKEQWRIAKIIYLNENINEERNNKTFMNLPLDREVTVKKKNITGMLKTKESPDTLERFNNFLEKDEKLKKLYNGEFETQFKSRSEAEMSLIVKLFQYKFNKSEINLIMGNCLIGKWKETTEAYKKTTLKKAADFVKKNPKSKFNKNSILEKVKKIPKDTTNSKQIVKIFNKIPISEDGFRNKVIELLTNRLENYRKGDLRDIIKKTHKQKEKTTPIEAYEITKEILDKQDIYCPKELKNTVLVYNNGSYKEESVVFLDKIILDYFTKNKINKHLTDAGITSKLNLIKKHIKGETYCSIKEFNNYGNLINVRNGLIDISNIDNFKFLPHDPKYKLTIQIPTVFDVDAKCPNISKFIQEYAGIDDEDLIYESFGNALIGDPNRFQKFIIFFGEGATGKSTTLDILRKLLGSNNCASESLQDLIYSDFAGANLEHNLANIHGDLPDRYLKRAGIIKVLTGERHITINRKYGKRYKTKNTAMMFYSCNKIPITYDQTTAFFRRVNLKQYTNIIPEESRIDNYLDKIINEGELSGLLNLALNGLKTLCKRGHYDPKYSKDVQKTWEEFSQPLIQFFDKYCEFESNDVNFIIEKKDLLYVFNQFLNSLKFPKIQNIVKLSKDINSLRGYEIGTKRTQQEGNLYYYYTGLKFNEKISKDFEITNGMYKEEKKKSKKESIDGFLEKNQNNERKIKAVMSQIIDIFEVNNNKPCSKDSIAQGLEIYHKKEHIKIALNRMYDNNKFEKSPKGIKLKV